ncbi:hypothetical protein B7486_64335, partial [cyanobacterium TDX16]
MGQPHRGAEVAARRGQPVLRERPQVHALLVAAQVGDGLHGAGGAAQLSVRAHVERLRAVERHEADEGDRRPHAERGPPAPPVRPGEGQG